jgi:serine/threonine-protein kinase RsbW
MATLPNVVLDLPNRPENVLPVREALTGIAAATGLDPADLSDIRTAATEACNNVVLHAYAGEQGSMEVEIGAGHGFLAVVVRDHGVGMPPELPAGGEETGIGLPVIRALARHVEFREPPGGGTEVRMEFAAPGSRDLSSAAASKQPGASSDGEAALYEQSANHGSSATVTIAPAGLARAVLPRVLTVFAARSHFTTDRVSDAVMLADAIVAHGAGAIAGSSLRVSLRAAPRSLAIEVGPLEPGRAHELVAESDVQGLGAIVGKLTDGHEVLARGSHDVLALRLQDPRR